MYPQTFTTHPTPRSIAALLVKTGYIPVLRLSIAAVTSPLRYSAYPPRPSHSHPQSRRPLHLSNTLSSIPQRHHSFNHPHAPISPSPSPSLSKQPNLSTPVPTPDNNNPWPVPPYHRQICTEYPPILPSCNIAPDPDSILTPASPRLHK